FGRCAAQGGALQRPPAAASPAGAGKFGRRVSGRRGGFSRPGRCAADVARRRTGTPAGVCRPVSAGSGTRRTCWSCRNGHQRGGKLTMKRSWIVALALIGAAALVGLGIAIGRAGGGHPNKGVTASGAAAGAGKEEETVWTCSMQIGRAHV